MNIMDSEIVPYPPRVYRCCCRRRFPLQRESNPLFRAVLSDDLLELKSLVESGHPVNIQNAKGSSLLNFAIRRKRVQIFDYLLSLDEVDVNFRDRLEQTPLLYLAGVCFDEYFALELIKKGADIHITDDSGFSFLHLAAKAYCDDNLKVGQLIIEKGADVNLQGHYGVTPLYLACEEGNFDWICMLLYYGADATIAANRGILPVAVISTDIPDEQQLQLQEIIFNYTFGEEKVTLRLPTLTAAMTLNSDLFPRLLEKASDVDYGISDLQHLVSSLIHVKPKHFKLFLDKFGYIVKEMIDHFSPMDVLIKIALDCGISGLREIIEVFLDSNYIAEFIQSSDPTLPTISRFIQDFSNEEDCVGLEKFTQIVCLMLSYGLGVTSVDLDAVYNHYGICELFRILLHMDITLIHSNNDNNNDVRSLAVLYYNPNVSIDIFFNDFTIPFNLLHYYNHPKLKEIFLASCNNSEDVDEVKKLPEVPYLIELSRNAVREYIVHRFNIESSIDFYTVLQALPIGEMNKKIIALEKRIY